MDIGNLTLTPSPTALGVFALATSGLVVWWLVRKRQRRVWLPTVRIMRLESRLLPRLLLRPPPLVSFLCFLVAAAVLFGFAMRPRTQVFTPFEPNQTRIHVFCDMSPSVTAYVTIEEYATRMAALYESLKAGGRVSFSTSNGPETFEPETAQAAATFVRAAGFHRAGLRLGTAMRELLAQREGIDRLFLVTDRDQHTWTGFNWQYLLDEMNVVFYDLGGAGGRGGERRNLFINDARFLSSPSSPTMDWDVEIARAGDGGAASGRLEVTYMGKSLGTFPWTLAAGKPRLSVRATWPATDVTRIDPAGARDVPLVFRIEADGKDAIAADNEFRAALLGLKQDALVVSESTGERLLEDPAEQLEVALRIQGFRLTRADVLTQPAAAAAEYPFLVLMGGAEGGVDRFCPRALETARLAARGKLGAAGGRRRALPKVWLMPQTTAANYRDLCRCFARLLMTTSPGGAEPPYCQGVEARSQWAGLLPSLGAKPVGGALGDAAKTLAWSARDAASGLEVLAFTVPLTPAQAAGINHAQMPILVKELLTWQGLLEGKAAGDVAGSGWPRVDDIVEKVWKAPKTAEPALLARLRATNVPLGESLLGEVDEAQLPPRWTTQMNWADRQQTAKKDREDPLPWLKLAALAVVGVTGFEAAFALITRLVRFVGRRPEGGAAALLAALLGAGFAPPRAEARVELNLVGYPGGPMAVATLAREVAHRTSIELEPKPLSFAKVAPDALAEPWLWVRDPGLVTESGGGLRPDVVLWIKRGGLLILEAPAGAAQLARLTTLLPPAEPGDGWQPLPPDHELMRSFYLLDALPSCNGDIWRGFHYDGRLAVLALPYGLLNSLKDHPEPPTCANPPDQERSVRVFVNLIMVALATDYKKDQIHLPEILKRLR